MPTRLGLSLPQARQYDIGRDVPDVARTAERIGYDSLWVYERALFPDPATQGLGGMDGVPWPDQYRGVPEPLVTLTLAAAATERAELGTSVLVAPLHGPFQLARTLGTLDAASGGRVVAGFGTGWSLDEYAAAGVAPFEERGRVLDEIIDVCRAVWGPDPVLYEGRHTRIASSVIGPKPARPIPILLPSHSRKAMIRLVDRADGWMPIAMGAGQLADQWRQLQDLAAARGRARPIRSAVRVNAQYTAKAYDAADRAAFQGSVDQIVEDLVAHAEIGLDEFFFELQGHLRDVQELKDVATEVYEKARAAGV
ncbi:MULTISPECIES: LLM class F420-dependent oxidoreductase [unclassified Streptomyces]|uniref:LLM class F420-dependent oxidoreductase n=1 Tax=unclassified Streptomyces TaxID=2593676 RepID=UPI002256FC93|nr:MULTISPECIES: LLM class F420-dependent oxidoreductase [unclassified Streptomyces]MCX5046749.1 LLM class F420-dependent oxidoreductase [Streptomyces sp. NBC_00474]MCX5058552.1 LLM class F420-dependent oxidoreductase [Streptomyces sp. NBC_00452]MCX5244568.1 LLM class F420-dependent oxidoreductase [Streptomyces sp. NBC_00201]MCX5289700.1 LLM class F420-dependent oxidoreductase [Streptomyces sp. NBC_00183]